MSVNELVSRYRRQIQDSEDSVKALSASRQKSLTNQSSAINIPNISSTQSLKKPKNPVQTYTHQKQTINQDNEPKANSQLPVHKNAQSQNMSLPPQPQNLSTNKKEKQKPNPNALNITSNEQALKSSRRINENNMPEKEKEKQKSKSKKASRTPQKVVVLTPESLNETYGENILSIFLNDLKQKNAPGNLLALINKQDLKQKVKLLLEQYFSKRIECLQKEKVIADSYVQHVERSNRQMAQSYVVQPGYPSNVLVTNDQPSSMNHLPSRLSRTQLSVKSKEFSSDIEKRCFETQKERQYLQNKVQTLSKRIEILTKDLEKYSKIEKLINNTIESQNQCRKEVNRLRKELEFSALKNTQQQKIWRKQVCEMKDIIMELKNQLIKSHQPQKLKN